MTTTERKSFLFPIPDSFRLFMSEFLGTFMQVYLTLSSLMLIFTISQSAIRLYSDPNYNICQFDSTPNPLPPTNLTLHLDQKTFPQSTCIPIDSVPAGKRAKDVIYNIELNPVYAIIIAFTGASGLLGSLFVSVPVSGGYLNPAISVCLATMSRLHWKKLIYYLPAQYAGSFVAAMILHGLYYEHIVHNKETVLSSVLLSTPHNKINLFRAFFDGLLSCAIFSMFLMAILDHTNHPLPTFFQPMLIVFTFFGTVFAFLVNCDIALNPARDFGTRLYAGIIIGFDVAFRDQNYSYWLVSQQLSLYLGHVIGGWTYIVLFGPRDLNTEYKSNSKTNVKELENKNMGKTKSNTSEENRIRNEENIQKDKIKIN